MPRTTARAASIAGWIAASLLCVQAAARTPEELVVALETPRASARLETADWQRAYALNDELPSASFTDAQRIRITAALLQPGAIEPYNVLYRLPANFRSQLPPAAITNLVELFDRLGFDHVSSFSALEVLETSIHEGRVDAAGYARITSWLTHAAASRRAAAVRLMGATPGNDPMAGRSMELLVHHLEADTESSVRTFAAQAIAKRAAETPPNEAQREAVLSVALNSPTWLTRLDATELVVDLGVSDNMRERLSIALATELQKPDGFPLSLRGGESFVSYESAKDRARRILARLYPTAPPPHVIDAYIALCGQRKADCVETGKQLEAARARNQLSTDQLARFEAVAVRIFADSLDGQETYAMFDIVFEGTDPRSNLPMILQDLRDVSPDVSYRAAFRLKYIAQHFGLTTEAIGTAEQIFRDTHASPKLREIVATSLTSQTQGTYDPSPVFLAVLRGTETDANFFYQITQLLILSRGSKPGGRAALIGFAADLSLPESVRLQFVSSESMRAGQGESLPEDIERALQSLTGPQSSKAVRRAAEEALKRYGKLDPIRALRIYPNWPTVAAVSLLATMLLTWAGFILAGLATFRRWSLAAWIVWSLLAIAFFTFAGVIVAFGTDRQAGLLLLVFLANLAIQAAFVILKRRRRIRRKPSSIPT